MNPEWQCIECGAQHSLDAECPEAGKYGPCCLMWDTYTTPRNDPEFVNVVKDWGKTTLPLIAGHEKHRWKTQWEIVKFACIISGFPLKYLRMGHLT